jgi:hypothetical protein
VAYTWKKMTEMVRHNGKFAAQKIAELNMNREILIHSDQRTEHRMSTTLKNISNDIY